MRKLEIHLRLASVSNPKIPSTETKKGENHGNAGSRPPYTYFYFTSKPSGGIYMENYVGRRRINYSLHVVNNFHTLTSEVPDKKVSFLLITLWYHNYIWGPC